MKQLKRAVEKQPIYAFFVMLYLMVWTFMLLGIFVYSAQGERLDIDYPTYYLATAVLGAMLVRLFQSGAE